MEPTTAILVLFALFILFVIFIAPTYGSVAEFMNGLLGTGYHNGSCATAKYFADANAVRLGQHTTCNTKNYIISHIRTLPIIILISLKNSANQILL